MQKLITYIEAADPTPSNNVAAGFAVGHFWRNSVSGKLFYHKLDGVWESLEDSLNLKAEITTFENTVVNNWVADTTYANFGYKADISLSGVISTDIIEIVFGHNEAVSGYYSPICLVDNGKITIYGKVNATITIPLIIKFKQ